MADTRPQWAKYPLEPPDVSDMYTKKATEKGIAKKAPEKGMTKKAPEKGMAKKVAEKGMTKKVAEKGMSKAPSTWAGVARSAADRAGLQSAAFNAAPRALAAAGRIAPPIAAGLAARDIYTGLKDPNFMIGLINLLGGEEAAYSAWAAQQEEEGVEMPPYEEWRKYAEEMAQAGELDPDALEERRPPTAGFVERAGEEMRHPRAARRLLTGEAQENILLGGLREPPLEDMDMTGPEKRREASRRALAPRSSEELEADEG